MFQHDSDRINVGGKKNLSILDLILYILISKSTSFINAFSLNSLHTNFVWYKSLKRSSIEKRKVSLIFFIKEQSVVRSSRLVIRVVITGITIDNVGNESQANFLVAASKGSNKL